MVGVASNPTTYKNGDDWGWFMTLFDPHYLDFRETDLYEATIPYKVLHLVRTCPLNVGLCFFAEFAIDMVKTLVISQQRSYE